MKRVLLGLLVVVFCSGCAIKAQVYTDEFTGKRLANSKLFSAPKASKELFSEGLNIRFGYYPNSNGVGMSIERSAGGWIYLYGGQFEGEEEKMAFQKNRSIGVCNSELGCTVHEQITISLTVEEFERLAQKTRKFRAVGNSKQITVWIPAEEMQAFIEFVKVSFPGEHKFTTQEKVAQNGQK